jgi:hypothetical protein
MSKADTWEQGLLDLLFLNTAFTLVGDAGGLLPSVAAGSLQVSAHTAAPLDTGTQATAEATYTSYARVAVARTAGGFVRAANVVSNVAAVTFPTCTGAADSQDLYFWGIGTSSAGAGKLLYWRHFGNAAKCASAIAATNLFTSFAHGLAVDNRICFYAPDPTSGGAMPGALVEGTIYFVLTVPTADTFTISATQGGATFDITTDGCCDAGRIIRAHIEFNGFPQIPIGQMQIAES